MSKSPRASRGSISQEAEPSQIGEAPETVEKTRPRDPVVVATRRLLGRALLSASISLEDASKAGVVTLVLLPSTHWTDATVAEWKSWAKGGRSYSKNREWSPNDANWSAWIAYDAAKASIRETDAELFACSIASGFHCAGFAANADWLLPDLVRSADYRLQLPLLNGKDVSLIATVLCDGAPSCSLSDEEASALTPRLLRLARRPGQTADAYILKLRDLLPGKQEKNQERAKEAPKAAQSLDRLHGLPEAVSWGLDLARDLQAYKDGKLPWQDVDCGCLLSGPPGCGKTLFAQALATTCDVPLVSGSYGEWHSTGTGHQGDFLQAMRRTFAEARADTPCILFIDEIDSFPNRDTLKHHYAEYSRQIVNSMLSEIDGIDGREGIVLIGACNHPDKLDPAMTRSGRLDRHIRISLPDRAALAKILREHLKSDLQDANLHPAAVAATGASGADCERLVRGARRRARVGNRELQLADLMSEIGGTSENSDADLWTAAVHESGHAVATCLLRPGSLEMLSIQRSGDARGVTFTNSAAIAHMSAKDFDVRLILMLAGRAAEEEILGSPSSGSGGPIGSDLSNATHMAAQSYCTYGLDEAGGLVWRGALDIQSLAEALLASPALEAQVRVRLDTAYAAARALLRENMAALFTVATTLFKRRVLDGYEVEEVVRDAARFAASPYDRAGTGKT